MFIQDTIARLLNVGMIALAKLSTEAKPSKLLDLHIALLPCPGMSIRRPKYDVLRRLAANGRSQPWIVKWFEQNLLRSGAAAQLIGMNARLWHGLQKNILMRSTSSGING